MIVCKDLHKSYKNGRHSKEVLRGVNLEIRPGEHIGLLGRNGAGKTTLIKLLGGVEYPTRGTVERTMSVSWPLGFSGGFQGSLTGLDNARFIARIYGTDYQELRDFVEDFSELGAQLKQPTKTYSSGMRARLAFALSLAIEFDCYLIDEVIMVGDQNFQRKCHYELFEKRHDRTLFLASHGFDILRNFCDRAILLHDGKAESYDDIEAALTLYEAL